MFMDLVTSRCSARIKNTLHFAKSWQIEGIQYISIDHSMPDWLNIIRKTLWLLCNKRYYNWKSGLLSTMSMLDDFNHNVVLRKAFFESLTKYLVSGGMNVCSGSLVTTNTSHNNYHSDLLYYKIMLWYHQNQETLCTNWIVWCNSFFLKAPWVVVIAASKNDIVGARWLSNVHRSMIPTYCFEKLSR